MKLQPPKDKRGYTGEELLKIAEDNNIDRNEFNKAIGVNTCQYDPETDTIFTYECDVKNALNKIFNGKYLFFD